MNHACFIELFMKLNLCLIYTYDTFILIIYIYNYNYNTIYINVIKKSCYPSKIRLNATKTTAFRFGYRLDTQ